MAHLRSVQRGIQASETLRSSELIHAPKAFTARLFEAPVAQSPSSANDPEAAASDDSRLNESYDEPDEYIGNEDVTPEDFIPTELVKGRYGWEHRPMAAAKWARIRSENIAAANERKRLVRARVNSRRRMRPSSRRPCRRRVRRAVRRQTSGASSPSAPPGPADGSSSWGAA